MGAWDGEAYQQRFDRLTAQGQDVHGEADFVQRYGPASVLDAGCGSGRVAIALTHRGIDVVGTDIDPSMLATARRLAPELTWVEADLTELALNRTFDIVVMAGSVPLFVAPSRTDALLAACAQHVRPGGKLIAGFHIGRNDVPNPTYGPDDYATDARAAGLVEHARFGAWDASPFSGHSDYIVAVHTRPAA